MRRPESYDVRRSWGSLPRRHRIGRDIPHGWRPELSGPSLSIGTFGVRARRRGSLLHVPRALELNRLLAGPVHLRDQVDRVLEVPVVRGDPPETEQDEGHRDRQGERPARHGAGMLAGGAGLLAMFLMRAFGLGVFLPEIAVDFVVGRIPGGIESFFIRTLGEGAKLLALLTALAVFLILPGIYATLFRRVQRWLKNRWLVMAFYTLSSAGIVLLVILPLLDAGFLGSNTAVGVGFTVFSQLIGYWLYAAILDHVLVDVAAEYPEGFSLSRRQFIAGTIGAIALAGLTIYGVGSLIAKKGRR